MRTNQSAGLKKYCRRVKGKLLCDAKAKKKLLAGLEDELRESGCGADDYQQLVRQVGSPESVAAQLQESVSDEERQKAERRRKRLPVWIAAAVVLALAAGTAWYLHYLKNSTPAYYTETVIEETPEQAGQEVIWGSPDTATPTESN